MRKTIFVFIVISVVSGSLLLFNSAHAISGACSWHDGVDCNKGWQADGRVYCNDGWTDSMVYYDYTKKCENVKFAPECVNYITGKDEYLKEIYRLIDKAQDSMIGMDLANPFVRQKMDGYMNYLYTLRDRQISRYNEIARICTEDIERKKQEYLRLQRSQQCPDGYVLEDNQCITKNQGCKNVYGPHSYYTGEEYICDCLTGYEWQGQTCVKKQEPPQQILSCPDDYVLENSQCITKNQGCKNAYGPYSYYTGTEYTCDCLTGYEWNLDRTVCIPTTATEEQILGVQIDMNLADRLKGKLLLQTEHNGRIWYVNPEDSYRHEVTFANALSLFENLALGISNQDLNQILLSTDNYSSSMGDRLKGKLLLQVEDGGRIWYVDFDGRRWEITWDNLMTLFESLALGITNQDLSKIPIGN